MTTETGAKSDTETNGVVGAKIPIVKAAAGAISAKKPFDIDEAIVKLREAVRPYPPAALFQLADEGFASPFEQLLACIISIRTLDETTILCAHHVFTVARTPAQLLELGAIKLDQLIHPSTFHDAKARQMIEIARVVLEEYDGVLPCDFELLTSFAGVGPKCANLVLGIACKMPSVSVDIHVHRVTNRWGYVQSKTPEQTMVMLEQKLPRAYWIEINRLLVPFGKHICTGMRPHCSTCVLLDMCEQVGVENPR